MLDNDSSDSISAYLERRISIDTRSLASFRVIIGLTVFLDTVMRLRRFHFFYTDRGVLPLELVTSSDSVAFSFYHLSDSPEVVAILFFVQALVALQMAVGYRTRMATVLTFLFVASLHQRAPMVLNSGDALLRMLLLWSIFLPLGERWSVDAVHRGESRDNVFSVATVIILCQMVYFYLKNGIEKASGSVWFSETVVPRLYQLDQMTFFLGDIIGEFTSLLYLGGRVWELMLMAAWVLLLLRGRERTAFVAMFAAVHFTIGVSFKVAIFSVVPIAGLFLFLQGSFWEDVRHLGSRFDEGSSRVRRFFRRVASSFPNLYEDGRGERLREGVHYLGILAVVVVLIAAPLFVSAVSVAQIEAFNPGNQVTQTVEASSEDIAQFMMIQQPEWNMFAPVPLTTERYYVFAAETDSGDWLDVYNDRRVNLSRAEDGFSRPDGITLDERFSEVHG